MKSSVKTGKPSRLRTAITLGLIFIWLCLISFAFIAASEPPWLKNISKFGKTGESRTMKDLGDNYLRQKNFLMAIAHYQRALEIKPDFVGAMTNLAIALNFTGNGERGIKILRDALKLNSGQSGVIYFNMAQILEGQGKKKEAIEYYMKTIDSEVEQDMVYRRLGILYLDAKEYENARVAFEMALQIQTDAVTPYLNMLKLNLEVYRADKDNLRIIEQMIKDSLNAEDLKYFDLNTIETINRSDPEIARTHNYLGIICTAQGNVDRAREHFEESQRIWPENIDARNSLQMLMQKKK
jgi:tetratricopeptide (TPR) repeat protein